MLVIKGLLVVLAIVFIIVVYNLIQRRKNKWLYRKSKEGFNGTGTGTTGTSTTGTSTASNVAPANTKRYDQPMAYTQPSDSKDPAYVALTNTANIGYLKGEVDKLSGLREKVTELEKRVNENSAAIVNIGDQMSRSAQEASGRSPDSKEPIPQATGL